MRLLLPLPDKIHRFPYREKVLKKPDDTRRSRGWAHAVALQFSVDAEPRMFAAVQIQFLFRFGRKRNIDKKSLLAWVQNYIEGFKTARLLSAGCLVEILPIKTSCKKSDRILEVEITPC